MANNMWTTKARSYIGQCKICKKNVFNSYIKEGDEIYHKNCYLRNKGLIQKERNDEKCFSDS